MSSSRTHGTSLEVARRLGIGARRVRVLAASGRIPGAMKLGRDWLIPIDAEIRPGARGPALGASKRSEIVIATAGRSQSAKQRRQRAFRKRALKSSAIAQSAVVFRIPRELITFEERDLTADDLT